MRHLLARLLHSLKQAMACADRVTLSGLRVAPRCFVLRNACAKAVPGGSGCRTVVRVLRGLRDNIFSKNPKEKT